MSSGIATVRTSSDEEELHKLVEISGDNNDDGCKSRGKENLKLRGTGGGKKPSEPGFFQRLILQMDEHVSIKLLISLWGPRLEFIVRLMLVATFLDDSFHSVIQFSEHSIQIRDQGCLKWLAATSPELAGVIAKLLLGMGLLAQSLGSLCVLALKQLDIATKALIGWTIAQPVIYAQLSNALFVAESLSLVGGLLTLQHVKAGAGPHTQLLGRLLLPAVYVYFSGLFLVSAFTLDETNNIAMYLSSLSMFAVNTVALVGLVIGTMFVAAGLKSRTIAFLLSLTNLGYVFYQHPFFRFIWFEGGEWKFKDDMPVIPNIVLPEYISESDFDFPRIYDLHRYYFFLGLSTSGALLLLAQFGPGEIALQKDEKLLPYVARAQD